jgi:hypothetical protein
VTYEEIPARGQLFEEPLDKEPPRLHIEINHDISAENDIEPAGYGIAVLKQVHIVGCHVATEFRLDAVIALPFANALLEVADQQIGMREVDLVRLVDAQPACGEHATGNI